MPERIPSPFVPSRQALIEPIEQPLYSSVVLTAASPETQKLFFQETQGSSGSSPLFTNMETAGQLSNPKIFTVRGFRLHVQQNVAQLAVNVQQFGGLLSIIESYWYRFFVGTKEYLRVPSFYLSSGLGAWFSAAGGDGANFASTAELGVPQHSNFFKIPRAPITIPPQQNFQAEMNLGTTLASFTGSNRRIYNFLEGTLGREVM